MRRSSCRRRGVLRRGVLRRGVWHLIACATLLSGAMPAPAWAETDAGEATSRPAAAASALDVIADSLAFEDRFVVDAYRDAGHRDARWDADAMRLLPEQLRAAIADRFEPLYRPTLATARADRSAMARRIAAAGCDDAIVCLEAGDALAAVKDRVGAAELYARADAAARTSSYRPLFQLLIARANAASNGETPANRVRRDELLQAAICDRATLPEFRRVVWNVGEPFFDAAPDDGDLLRIADAIDGLADADPWIANVVIGRAELARAGFVSDDIWASQSSQNPPAEVAAHLAAAREHFERAVAADDRYPHPFAYMIAVAMHESAGHEDDWRRFALDRQIDFNRAWDLYFVARLPEHGGSDEQVLRAGREAVATGRYDTRAPMELLRAIELVEYHRRARLDAAEVATIYPDVVRCLDGYLAASADRPAVRAGMRSLRIAWAARAERWDEAAAQFEKLAADGDAPDEAAFTRFGLDLATVRQRSASDATRPARPAVQP